MSERRIVVTGIGVLAPNGSSLPAFWHALLEGKSSAGPVTRFDTSHHARSIGAEIKDFDVAKALPHLHAPIGRASALAAAAARQALAHAGLEAPPPRSLLCLGSTMGDVDALEQLNDQWLEGGTGAMPRDVMSGRTQGGFMSRVADAIGLVDGEAAFLTNACSSGNAALAWAAARIRRGGVDCALAGGAEAFSRVIYTGFGRLGAVAREKCQPFDKNRTGILIGEGAGVLVLEALESAQRRGAKIHAELAGFAMTCDAFHITGPRPDRTGMSAAMRGSLQMAGASPDEVGYVGAHGTGTPANDKVEAGAIHDALGKRAETVPVSSIKSMIGHTMGAASALSSIACIMALNTGKIPPTANFETADPECNIDCVPNVARSADVRLALCNSAAFGGNNACLAFRRSEAS